MIQLPDMAICLYVWAKKSFLDQGLLTPGSIHSADYTIIQKRNASKGPRNINPNVISETKLSLKVTKYKRPNCQISEHKGIQRRLNAMNQRIDGLTANYEHINVKLNKIIDGMTVSGYLEI